MARQPQSRGTCTYCGKDFARGGMTKHLATCPARAAAFAAAEAGNGKTQALYHLTVSTPGSGLFWLQLEMNGSATLETLDNYLRAIWLECCGHLSAFAIGGRSYTQVFDDGMGDASDRSMKVRADKVLSPGMAIPYEYDFGSTTELLITVQSVRQGKPTTKHPIALLARNEMPAVQCAECDQPAAFICAECLWDRDLGHFFCAEHAAEHEHEEMLMGVWNSPRTGVCGYDGPAEPPY